ncbi:hypothetical protein RHCRD62_90107 [Rhodococcus sp. RD6.2]|nr:hypothetical protein RHCRD62_90107 [Rhodococcus sp. RD6.2]
MAPKAPHVRLLNRRPTDLTSHTRDAHHVS